MKNKNPLIVARLIYPFGKVFYKVIPIIDEDNSYLCYSIKEVTLTSVRISCLGINSKKTKYCKSAIYTDENDNEILRTFNGDITKPFDIFENLKDAEKYVHNLNKEKEPITRRKKKIIKIEK